jgi:hypothetical protein
MTMRPDRIDDLREIIIEALEDYGQFRQYGDTKTGGLQMSDALANIIDGIATYLEGADILPEKRPKRKVKNELDSIADYVDQGFNQAIDTTAANLAGLIRDLRGTK